VLVEILGLLGQIDLYNMQSGLHGKSFAGIDSKYYYNTPSHKKLVGYITLRNRYYHNQDTRRLWPEWEATLLTG